MGSYFLLTPSMKLIRDLLSPEHQMLDAEVLDIHQLTANDAAVAIKVDQEMLQDHIVAGAPEIALLMEVPAGKRMKCTFRLDSVNGKLFADSVTEVTA